MAKPEDNEKALSDDDSYDFVDHQEPDHRISDFEERISAAGSNHKKLELYLDVGTDDDSNGENTNGHSDGSYEFVDSEEVGEHVPQREEDLCSESSDSSAGYNLYMDREIPWKENDDGPEKDGIFCFQTVAYQKGLYMNVPDHTQDRSKMTLEDVVKDLVLPSLPAKSLIKFRAVSKEWDKWIASPFLAHLQSNHFKKISGFFRASPLYCKFISLDHLAHGIPSQSLSFMPEHSFAIKSSCNGLLLCQGYNGDNTYYIVNPTNKEWRSLPEPNYYHPNESKCVLVFDPSPLNFPAHFKVICAISVPPYDIPILRFEIYDSETKSWILSEVICTEVGDSLLIKDGFYFNGVAYWETCQDELLAFDLKNEICGLQPLPLETKCIGVFDGKMCYIRVVYGSILEIYGDYLSLKCTIQIGNGSPSVLNDLHVLSPVGNDFARIFLEEMKGSKVKDIDFGKCFPYVNSLVSLEHQ